MLKLSKTNPKDLVKVQTAYGPIWMKVYLDEESCLAGLEDFHIDERFREFTYFTHGTQYVINGEAEITYSDYTTMMTEKRNIKLKEGDLFYMSPGTRIQWNILKEPFRLFWTMWPNPKTFTRSVKRKW